MKMLSSGALVASFWRENTGSFPKFLPSLGDSLKKYKLAFALYKICR